ncbi:hypothetical protein AAHA92_19107 [Salvia divinorum]|uniref:Uncharacterized protein n=1 Tax=Salvia divinorum TaxID=28513 RepID=A0ABD1H494_SALDI
MEAKADSSRAKYEGYENDTFYLELEREIVRLIDDVNADELKPRKSKYSGLVTDETRLLLHRRSYYDWSVCKKAVKPPAPAYFPAANAGTGVFIPQHHGAKFEFRDCRK